MLALYVNVSHGILDNMTDNLQSFSTARGMTDLLPEDMRSFRYIEDIFREISGNWGYEEVRTPSVENYNVLYCWIL